ncbi:NADH-FMN oxidoreductase RutF, flavin reductase (DIM6/NTAB) family [Marivirga sericea]|uniref:NADH-FMN oxidoreductase RutF, flavin reductase (DIM6/NTAB) family n=1 Tax=Marivirga sericea TaxID=1028 RepID=A0A1X7JPD3_9BACT|nr:flavin reductase family protein [Marivirga sericea]SMG29865.1 NADH-FMN oxidoreductase RutF, flavin reductase (DIM6/NTAB) family [Marivirga sericea]
MSYKEVDPKSIKTPELHALLLGAIAPRPIAFASTIDKEGNVNLSPFSFFNVFGSNPPILIFSPARRGRNNTTKHSYDNVKEIAEVVINIANYPMVEQMSLASTEYDKGVNEFVKAGFTQANSTKVKPPRVAESPVAFECKVKQVIETGEDGGAGNLVICEVIHIHIDEEILDENGKIDPLKLDPIGRLGGNWYSRSKNALFEVEKPLQKLGIGVDALPNEIKNSRFLTGNDLGKLGNIEKIPERKELQEISINFSSSANSEEIHALAHHLLEDNKVMEAWKVLLNF